MVSEMEAMMVT
jgi:hypothetical protein